MVLDILARHGAVNRRGERYRRTANAREIARVLRLDMWRRERCAQSHEVRATMGLVLCECVLPVGGMSPVGPVIARGATPRRTRRGVP